ncbi:hypothetical protein CYLTODRAFT_385266 [Cylindrobasidium torrendii FP15055 ss-10]|uniref:Zn(2)-C6 fungal-type domain-containing protein n=1 Tax=Cylindrobasidium torrendii FP15055 ss-10 TaxID=1314674 RepID=A0A0D7BVZ6_9AGAR|nr:hypothetical protein CYLTODRAFT_385266 [Cylindrobasidium torrendii FP15055 ss-10]
MHDPFIRESPGDAPAQKKRRLPGACDACKRKKIKCDSAMKPDGHCSNCIQYGQVCTHGEPIKKRGPKSSYVTELEDRVRNLESMLAELNPSAFTNEEQKSPSSSASPSSQGADFHEQYITRTDSIVDLGSSGSAHVSLAQPATGGGSPAQDFDHNALTEHLKRMKLTGKRFFGHSSAFAMAKNAMEMRADYTGEARHASISNHSQYWQLQPWEELSRIESTPKYEYPPQDLLDSLVTIWFTEFHTYTPIFHRASFEDEIRNGLHLVNPKFGALVLLVCACASKSSEDPRVLVDGETSWLSAGWKYYSQTQIVKNTVFDAPDILDLQFCVLATMYSLSTSAPQTSWTMSGLGLRFMIEIGCHRRQTTGKTVMFEDEMCRRLFWTLLEYERVICLFLGRPSYIRDEDFDVEPCTECDDEYWEIGPNGELSFHQPPDRRARMVFFNQKTKVLEILGTVMRSLYAVKKPTFFGLNEVEKDQRIVSDLDSALNNWADSVPDYLRWDPNSQQYRSESACLYCIYYLTQIALHRPFIHTHSPLSFSSLAICTNAARASSHIIDQEGAVGSVYQITTTACFTSGVILSMNIWSSKRSGLNLNTQKDLQDINRCLSILKSRSAIWNTSGRMWSMLSTISAFADTVPSSDTPSRKRARDDNDTSTESSKPLSCNAVYHPYVTPSSLQQTSDVQTGNVNALSLEVPRSFDYADPLGNASDIDGMDLNQFSMDAIDIWSSAPESFVWQDWNAYLTEAGMAMPLREDPMTQRTDVPGHNSQFSNT